jgi:hypothetical protein
VNTIGKRAGTAMGIMIGIELFQITGIPAQMVGSGTLPLRMAGRLLGTAFGWFDLIAYAVGIGLMAGWDTSRVRDAHRK